MDTSKQYIKMRKAAIPDMGCGNTTLTGRITQIFGNSAVMDEYGNYYAGYRSRCFKLERQDQLQEMMINEGFGCFSLHFAFNTFAVDTLIVDGMDILNLPFISLEQLWLAYVMHEKYSKHWNGEEWVTLDK